MIGEKNQQGSSLYGLSEFIIINDTDITIVEKKTAVEVLQTAKKGD